MQPKQLLTSWFRLLPPVEGDDPITLTAGTDSGADFTGTANNDEFDAPITQNPWAGGVSNSLSSADRLDGGAGSDTLHAELVPEFYGVTGDNQLDIQPRIQRIEDIKFEAMDVSSASNDGAIIVDAKNIKDVDKIGSYFSDADLVIENLTTLTYEDVARNTEDITITMDHTDNFNSDDDASDLTVYFDEDYLLAGQETAGASLLIRMINAFANVTGGNPIEGFNSIVFAVGDTEVTVNVESIAADTTLDYTTAYDAVVDAINAQLAADGFSDVTAEPVNHSPPLCSLSR
ncbi:MAG: hypothetical protein U5K27_05870 [Desulfotignum sp.]|nr:hypothetical protein [Desulfotignum sp.]